MESATPTTTLPVGAAPITIAGLEVHLHGLSALPANPPSITLITLLHPRLDSQSYLFTLAARLCASSNSTPTVCVTFDQRNHGTRLISPVANNAWRTPNDPNPTHAIDLFSCYTGTFCDLRHLLRFVPCYLPSSIRNIEHIVAGVSLGGHAAWLAAVHEPRVACAVIVIGCADYAALMTHRAQKSGVADWTRVGGAALEKAIDEWDPKAFGVQRAVKGLKGKRILVLQGGEDKLVPRTADAEFLEKLVKEEHGLRIAVEVEEGAGHEFTEWMQSRVVDWIEDNKGGGIEHR